MGLLSKLKSLFGVGGTDRSRGSGVDVTVEREPSTASERAVKEPAGDVDEPVASETDAAASTESLVDESHTEDPTRAAEPAEAAIAEDDDSEPEEPEIDAAESDAAESDAAESDAGSGAPVTTLKGIGPAYGDRLSEAGIESTADLADADAEDLAERIELSPKRVGRWVERAEDHEE